MLPKARKTGFTKIELVIVLTVVGIGLAIAIPYVQAARERARREDCINNMKQLGLALHNYHDMHKRFPGSADLIGTGPVKQAGGWSFLVRLYWSMMLDIDIINKLTNNTVDDPINSTDKNVVEVRNILVPELICPSNPNKHFQDPSKKLNAFTNYKGMGATSSESLICCADPDSPPPYGYTASPASRPQGTFFPAPPSYGNAANTALHPDGALFPGKGLRIADCMDGTANTIMAVETIDDSSSVWLAGSDATLVGMPKAAMTAPAEPPNGYPYWYPTGFNGKYDGDASPAIKALRTYLAYDFTPGGRDAGSYTASVGRTPKYGPSSGHPNVVNHLFVDGAVRTIANDVDYAMYFWAVTRNNNEP